MIILNTPHNPVGKVFTRDELMKIADIAKEFNIIVMSDEVVRRYFYLDAEHRSIYSSSRSMIASFTIRSTYRLRHYLACGKELCLFIHAAVGDNFI